MMLRTMPTAARAAATVCTRAAGPAPVARMARATASASAASQHPAATACAASRTVASRSAMTVLAPDEEDFWNDYRSASTQSPSSIFNQTHSTLEMRTDGDRSLFMSLPKGALIELTHAILEGGGWDEKAIKHLIKVAPHLANLALPYCGLQDLAGALKGVTTVSITQGMRHPCNISLDDIMAMAPDAQTVQIVGGNLKMDPHDDPSTPKYPNLHELILHHPNETDGMSFFKNLAAATRLEYLTLVGKIDQSTFEKIKLYQDRLGIINASKATTEMDIPVTEALNRE